MKILTAGESHGKGLYAILEGLPAGLEVDKEQIHGELLRRSGGYGRSERQRLERDAIEIMTGVMGGVTIGSPVTLFLPSRDSVNWEKVFSKEEERPITCPRPGHADFAGMQKFCTTDARAVSERASARSTAMRVAVGALLRQYLERLGVRLTGYVCSIGTVNGFRDATFEEIESGRGARLGMLEREQEAVALIDEAKKLGESLGGVVEVRAKGLKAGFGSCMQDDEKLDAQIAFAMMSVQAIKGVEIGAGFKLSERFGSSAQDEILIESGKLRRPTNNAGGIEGGMSNGEELVVRAAMKPIPTLPKGISSVDLKTGKAALGASERADVCAVTACEVVLENVLATVLFEAVVRRLGGDTLTQLKERYERL